MCTHDIPTILVGIKQDPERSLVISCCFWIAILSKFAEILSEKMSYIERARIKIFQGVYQNKIRCRVRICSGFSKRNRTRNEHIKY